MERMIEVYGKIAGEAAAIYEEVKPLVGVKFHVDKSCFEKRERRVFAFENKIAKYEKHYRRFRGGVRRWNDVFKVADARNKARNAVYRAGDTIDTIKQMNGYGEYR